ncbi:MAG: M20/M25/M40 family metallo-hydrolase [Candidatus Latescibacteria bacterium]|nr:M20/M25/M40 family metallo-hydrolase [Candidatus Latescibacterota bacterium]
MHIPLDRERMYRCLDQLLRAHAPSGTESEVDHLVLDQMRGVGDTVWQDAADNIIIHIRGQKADAPIAVTAHKDEISMVVKRVEEGGRLRVRPVGGLHPWAVGEIPVEIMGREGLLPGVLSIGSKHVSTESPAGLLKDGKGLSWDQMWVETKLSAEHLQGAGVRAGTKVVIARHFKTPWPMGEYLCGYNLDCRGGLAALLETAHQLKANPPAQDVYLIASAEEEIGAHGATYALGQLPSHTVIALDVVPVAHEYQVRNCEQPVLGCQDSTGIYHQRTNQQLERLAGELGFGVQTAVLTSYGSDATLAKSRGSTARAVLIGYPGDNTHGYEICHLEALYNSTRLLLAYLYHPLS